MLWEQEYTVSYHTALGRGMMSVFSAHLSGQLAPPERRSGIQTDSNCPIPPHHPFHRGKTATLVKLSGVTASIYM